MEEAVLGAVMLEKNSIVDIAGFLQVDHFYSEAHQHIYQAILDLFSTSDPIDMKTVVNRLRFNGKLEGVGGAYRIAELTSKVSSAANVEFHARVIVEMAMKRGLISLGHDMIKSSYDFTSDVFSVIEKSNLGLQEVMDGALAGRADKSIKEIAVEVVKEIQSRQSGKHSGLSSGYEALDMVTNGFHKTDLLIVAARPGMGKTAYCVQAAKQVAEIHRVPVGIISLEMSAKQIVERLSTAGAEVDSDKVRKGLMNELEHQRYNEAVGKISGLPIFIDDTPFMTIIELRARAMRMRTKHKIELLVVDYLQLIKGSDRTNRNRDQEIGEITRTLKGIAKELDIPVIALSQLSRGVETRGGSRRPILSDLRESGNIEQDADLVIFLYRPEYYGITVGDNGEPTHGLAEVIIAKHRNGSTDTVKQKFIGKLTKFSDWVSVYEPKDQSKYVREHYKDPTTNLPSAITKDDLPF